MKNKKLAFVLAAAFYAAYAIAGSDTIPTRVNGQTITADWSNLFKRVLAQDFLPRNTSGVVTDKAGSLGSSTYNWSTINTESMKLRAPSGSNQISLVAPSPLSSAYSLTLPTALPASTLPVSVSSTGVLSSAQILTAQITDLNVTTAKIADLNVTTEKINDAAVTSVKRSALGYSISGVMTASGSPPDLTAHGISYTSTGRPWMIVGIPGTAYPTSSDGYFCTHTNDLGCYVYIDISLNGAGLGRIWQENRNTGAYSARTLRAPCTIIRHFMPAVAAGAAQNITIYVSGSGTTNGVQNCRYMAYEL